MAIGTPNTAACPAGKASSPSTGSGGATNSGRIGSSTSAVCARALFLHSPAHWQGLLLLLLLLLHSSSSSSFALAFTGSMNNSRAYSNGYVGHGQIER